MKQNNKNQIDREDREAFPELTPKNEIIAGTQAKASDSQMNFAELMKRNTKEPPTNVVEPGYVNLTRNPENGTTRFAYGSTTTANTNESHTNESHTNEGVTSNQMEQLGNLVCRWQLYRDMMDKNYGESSPFYGMKRLTDPLSDDDYESDCVIEESDDDYETMTDEDL